MRNIFSTKTQKPRNFHIIKNYTIEIAYIPIKSIKIHDYDIKEYACKYNLTFYTDHYESHNSENPNISMTRFLIFNIDYTEENSIFLLNFIEDLPDICKISSIFLTYLLKKPLYNVIIGQIKTEDYYYLVDYYYNPKPNISWLTKNDKYIILQGNKKLIQV